MANNRHQLSWHDLEGAIQGVSEKVTYRIKQKGMGSNHEILGIINQETSEYEDSIHERLTDAQKIEELKDIAVAAIIGIASIKSGGIDW